jgi:hypothetical protein
MCRPATCWCACCCRGELPRSVRSREAGSEQPGRGLARASARDVDRSGVACCRVVTPALPTRQSVLVSPTVDRVRRALSSVESAGAWTVVWPVGSERIPTGRPVHGGDFDNRHALRCAALLALAAGTRARGGPRRDRRVRRSARLPLPCVACDREHHAADHTKAQPSDNGFGAGVDADARLTDGLGVHRWCRPCFVGAARPLPASAEASSAPNRPTERQHGITTGDAVDSAPIGI